MFPKEIILCANRLLDNKRLRRRERNGKNSVAFANFVELCNTYNINLEMIFGNNLSFNEIIFCVSHDQGPTLCNCGSVIKDSRLGRTWCSIRCRSNDKTYCKNIATIKLELYADTKWKNSVELKKTQTTMKNHGVAYPMQNITIFEKQQRACFKKDENGLHGYEPYIYPWLLQLYPDLTNGTAYLKENQIPIQWIGEDGKMHRSFPDFFTKESNTFIEIKSMYTRNLHNKKLSKCHQALKDMGYGYAIISVAPHKSYTIETFNLEYME